MADTSSFCPYGSSNRRPTVVHVHVTAAAKVTCLKRLRISAGDCKNSRAVWKHQLVPGYELDQHDYWHTIYGIPMYGTCNVGI